MEIIERRREARCNTEQMSKVTVVGTEATMFAVITDVSRSGMQLAVGEPFEPGTVLKIEMPDVSAQVEVKFCRANGENRYRVGVLTLDVQSGAREHPGQVLMTLYARGRGLFPSERIEVQAHLRTCLTCIGLLDRMDVELHPTRRPSSWL